MPTPNTNSALKAKFDALVSDLREKDVFSDEVNAVRARTLLLAESSDGKARRANGAPAHHTNSNGAVGRTASSSTTTTGGGSRSVALLASLESKLSLIEANATMTGASGGGGLPHNNTASGGGLSLRSVSPCDATTTTERRPLLVVGGEGGAEKRRLSRRVGAPMMGGGGPRRNSQLGGRKVSAMSENGTSQSLSAAREPEDSSTTLLLAGSGSPPLQQRHGSAEGGPSSSSLLPSVPQAVLSPHLTPSEWFQRSAEHRDYPKAEKEIRAHLQKQDDSHRGATPVERYTQPFLYNNPKARQWEEQAAKVKVAVFVPQRMRTVGGAAPTPQEGEADPQRLSSAGKPKPERAHSPLARKAIPTAPSSTSPSGQATATANNNNNGNAANDTFLLMQDRRAFLQMASKTREARSVYQQEIAKELLEAAAATLNRQVPRSASDPNRVVVVREREPDETSVASSRSSPRQRRDSDSDDEGEEDVVTRQSAMMDLNETSLVPGKRLPVTDPTLEATVETCELLECTTVCLCQCLTGVAKTAILSRDVAVLRTIVIHALESGLAAVRQEMARRARSGPLPPQPVVEEAIICRLLRSWTKGVETLLALELRVMQRDRTPFLIHSESHRLLFAQLYVRLEQVKSDRLTLLTHRWQANRDEAKSQILRCDHVRLVAPSPAATTATDLAEHFSKLAAVTAEDLTLLDHTASDNALHQQEIAKLFLDRIGKYLPSDHRKDPPEETLRKDAAIVTRDDLLAKDPPPDLRHVLLHYAGLLRPAERCASPSEVLGATSPQGVMSFLNVFRSTWGRTPLTPQGDQELADRAAVIESSSLLQLLDTFQTLLAPSLQTSLQAQIEEERRRVSAVARNTSRDIAEVESKLGKRSAPKNGTTAALLEDAQSESRKALQEVERHQLIAKYTRSNTTPETLEKLKKAVLSSEEWFAFEKTRRAARVAAAKNGGHADDLPPEHDGADANNNNNTHPLSSVRETSLSKGANATRMEMVRVRKVQELEAMWSQLLVGYGTRIALLDKWNHPSKDLRQVDIAVKLYRECLTAVEAREALLKSVLDNENVENRTEKIATRNQLLSSLSAAGQQCELLARKLLNDTGDELMFKNQLYLNKLKDDFAMLAQVLRMST